jgi:hypothetical protein
MHTVSDECDLKNPKKVEESQEVLTKAFQHIIQKTRPDDKFFFLKCLHLWMELRNLHEMHTKEESRFVSDWSQKIEFPPLLYEMWSI